MDTSLVTFGRGLGHLSMSCKFLLRDLQETRSWKQRALDKLEKQIGPSIDDQIRKLRMQLREVGCSESFFYFASTPASLVPRDLRLHTATSVSGLSERYSITLFA